MHDDRFLNEKAVSEYTGMSLAWLRQCRMKGTGIRYHKISASVRYKMSDVVEYMESHRVSVET